MVKPKINYITDLILLIVFLITAITGLVLFFMPTGPKSSLTSFLGIIKHTWTDIHNWVGIAFILIVMLHFLLHWKWFIAMTKNIFNKKF
jgi:cytochrome b subunit of formate dehydrogenase